MSKNIKSSTEKNEALATKWVQIISWFSLYALTLFDKILHWIQPPIPEYWYGLLFATASMQKIKEVFTIFRSK